MTSSPRRLQTVMYHYVRDYARATFPGLKGMDIADLRSQLEALRGRFELASLESALAFLAGDYIPSRDLCLLTFDDGLRDHYAEVMPLLAEHDVAGIFLVITSCLERRQVASVHKNQLLMAQIDFPEYQRAFVSEAAEAGYRWPDDIDTAVATNMYRWDPPDVSQFKYALSRRVPESVKEPVLDRLFSRFLGEEPAIAQQLYMSWVDAREMQNAGMIIGGHTHRHDLMARLSDEEQDEDLAACRGALNARLKPQAIWPFSYPYGRSDSFTDATVSCLMRTGFCCAFTTVKESSRVGQDPFRIGRVDPKDLS